MKDFVSKVTFGFLMAQLFPGATAVFAIGFTYFSLETNQPYGIIRTAEHVLLRWGGSSTPQLLFLVGLCVAAGMFIHGVQWASLGSLEHRSGCSAYETAWYQQRLWKQILTGPWQIVRELGEMLVLTGSTIQANMYESVTDIDRRLMQQFDFLEEFYLATGQFFLHTAYALTAIMLAITTHIVAYGLSWRRVVLLILIYLITGLFFAIGRIQMCSLFYAERSLAMRSGELPAEIIST